MLLKKFPACIPHFTIFFIENTCPNHFKQTDSSNGRKKTSYWTIKQDLATLEHRSAGSWSDPNY